MNERKTQLIKLSEQAREMIDSGDTEVQKKWPEVILIFFLIVSLCSTVGT